jgi:hypothetical protein
MSECQDSPIMVSFQGSGALPKPQSAWSVALVISLDRRQTMKSIYVTEDTKVFSFFGMINLLIGAMPNGQEFMRISFFKKGELLWDWAFKVELEMLKVWAMTKDRGVLNGYVRAIWRQQAREHFDDFEQYDQETLARVYVIESVIDIKDEMEIEAMSSLAI